MGLTDLCPCIYPEQCTSSESHQHIQDLLKYCLLINILAFIVASFHCIDMNYSIHHLQ